MQLTKKEQRAFRTGAQRGLLSAMEQILTLIREEGCNETVPRAALYKLATELPNTAIDDYRGKVGTVGELE